MQLINEWILGERNMRSIQQKEVNALLKDHTRLAVAHYWQTRSVQREKQEHGGKVDQGLRGAVTSLVHKLCQISLID